MAFVFCPSSDPFNSQKSSFTLKKEKISWRRRKGWEKASCSPKSGIHARSCHKCAVKPDGTEEEEEDGFSTPMGTTKKRESRKSKEGFENAAE